MLELNDKITKPHPLNIPDFSESVLLNHEPVISTASENLAQVNKKSLRAPNTKAIIDGYVGF